MENINLLIKALSVEGSAELKALIRQHFGAKNNPTGEMILKGFEDKPDIWEKPLQDVLSQTDADKDERIVGAARNFLDQRGIDIGGDAIDCNMIAGDNNLIIKQFNNYAASPEDAYALRNSQNKILPRLRGVGKKEIDELNSITYGDPMELARYYIEPNCQEVNPADDHEERFMHAREPVMKKIDEFFSAKVCQAGDNQLFILSDAGMGKTALLTMLKIMHLTAFWPSGKNCVLKKLGEKTLAQLAEIRDNSKTILLLDSLDEDPTAFGRVHARLMDILHATRHFYRSVITCRTQFFPDVHNDPFKRAGVAVIGGYRCPVKYLSFFDDEMVTKYLSKKFPKKFGLITDTKKIGEARKVIEKMGSLRCRPMLLAYIEDLMESPLLEKDDSEYQVYDALIRSWLIRETTKHKSISEKNLSDACIILATILQSRGRRDISENELKKLISKISEVRPIKDIDLKGRSLLNRNSEGSYRFSHYSIQEFLVVKLLLSYKPIFNLRQPILLTDFIIKMLRMSNKIPHFINLMDFRGLQLSNADLRGLKLPRANLKGIDLSESNLSNANLSNTDLSNTNLYKVNLSKANLKGANLKGVNLRGVNFSDADLSNANLSNANLSDTNLDRANFCGANLIGTELDKPDISNLNLNMKFVYIFPGEFIRNNTHKITLTKGFYMQTTPVTQSQWKNVMGYIPSQQEDCLDCPVENVSWNEVQIFIKRLNQKEITEKYRLPTEAEWEYSCRAGTNTAYYFGDDENILIEYAWYKKNSDKKPHPVGLLKPNTWGLYDMHGNVWEWCSDWYEDYPNKSLTDPNGPDKGSHKVIRGGGWDYVALRCRSAERNSANLDDHHSGLGFRLLREAS